jgi:AraC-like DNA-binding protein
MLYLLRIILLSFLVVNSLILIFKGNNNPNQIKGLGFPLFLYGLVFLVFTLWFDLGLIKEYPFLLRVFSPISFLGAPIFYLSLRNIVKNIKTFEKADFVHFVPAIFHFLELIPLYILSNQEKLQIIDKFYPDKYGFILHAHGLIPGTWINFLYLILLIVYFFLVLTLVFNFPHELSKKLKKEKFQNILYTTLVFYFIFNMIIIVLSFSVIQFYFTGLNFLVLRGFLLKILIFILIAYNLYFFLKIELNLGSRDSEKKSSKESLSGSNFNSLELKSQLGWNDMGLCKVEIESRLVQLFDKEKLFLIEGLSVSDFALKADIPLRLLPYVFNLIFQKNFKELILERRAHYARERIEDGYLDKFTLESLRIECGFGSRTAFFYAFKKEFELSPNEFWKVFQENLDQNV